MTDQSIEQQKLMNNIMQQQLFAQMSQQSTQIPQAQQNRSPIVGFVTADQLQQINILWVQMISILTDKSAFNNIQGQAYGQLQQQLAQQQAQAQVAQVSAQSQIDSNFLQQQLQMSKSQQLMNSDLLAQTAASAQVVSHQQQQMETNQIMSLNQPYTEGGLIQGQLQGVSGSVGGTVNYAGTMDEHQTDQAGKQEIQPITISDNTIHKSTTDQDQIITNNEQNNVQVHHPPAEKISKKQKSSSKSKTLDSRGVKQGQKQSHSVAKEKEKSGSGQKKSINVLTESSFKKNTVQQEPVSAQGDTSTAQSTQKNTISTKNQGSPEKKEKKRDPRKMGKNSYMFFRDEVLRPLMKENPNVPFPDIQKLVAEKFKALTDEEKQKYKDMATNYMEEKNKRLEQEEKNIQLQKEPPAPPQHNKPGPKPKSKSVPTKKKPGPVAKDIPVTTHQQASAAEIQDPFYFYKKIRQSELAHERQLTAEQKEANGIDSQEVNNLPQTDAEINVHIEREWKMLNFDQQARFNIEPDMQRKLALLDKMDDVQALRQLVLFQKLPDDLQEAVNQVQPQDKKLNINQSQFGQKQRSEEAEKQSV